MKKQTRFGRVIKKLMTLCILLVLSSLVVFINSFGTRPFSFNKNTYLIKE